MTSSSIRNPSEREANSAPAKVSPRSIVFFTVSIHSLSVAGERKKKHELCVSYHSIYRGQGELQKNWALFFGGMEGTHQKAATTTPHFLSLSFTFLAPHSKLHQRLFSLLNMQDSFVLAEIEKLFRPSSGGEHKKKLVGSSRYECV